MRSWRILAVVALLVAAVAVGGWLLGRSARPLASGVARTAQAGDLSVTVRLDDTVVGTRVVDVAVDDASGKPADVGAVRLSFAMADMNMGVSEVVAQPVGAGRFQARGQFFSMAGSWLVQATLVRDGQEPLQVPFRLAIAAPGEASGPLNPLAADAPTILAGQKLYLANCVTCHGPNGRGDGPSAATLNPRPADFTLHMVPGKHTDGQVFLWIKNGFPNSAMQAWDKRLTEQQIWQLVTYLRTFGQATVAQTTPNAQPGAAGGAAQPVAQPDALEPAKREELTQDGAAWLIANQRRAIEDVHARRDAVVRLQPGEG